MHIYYGAKLIEHMDIKWVDDEEIDTLKWLPADIGVLPKVKKTFVVYADKVRGFETFF